MSWFNRMGWFDSGARSAGKSKRKSRAKAATRGRSLRLEPLEKRLLLAITVVDPADGLRLMNSQALGNWSTPGNYDGWSVANAASSSVANGNLTVTSQTGANPVNISLTTIANGPFLDYGYFDYLQVRMQLPQNFNQPLTFSFGTTTNPGFSTARQFTVPANQVATDGQFHVYRLDLGLTVWWKDTLTDLQLQPLGSTGAGQTAVINYIEVGDLPGDVLTMTTASLGVAPAVNMANATCVQSKHYAFWYDSVDAGANPGGQTDWGTMANNVLHMLEECYQVYTKVQGYQEPFYWAGDGIRHKVNCTCWYGGYWMSGVQVNFDTSGLQDQGPGNPVPHEYGHFTDGQQPGFISGGDWESHANWHRESWIEWFSPYFAAQYGTQYQSTVGLGELQWSNWRQDTPRLIYADYRVFAAMQNYDPGLEAQMWEQGPQNMTVWDKLALILPSNENVEDVAATAESHWPMLDFSVIDADGGNASMGSVMRAALWDNATDQANFMYLTTTTLTPEADNSGWYTVPTERAPEKYAYDWSWLTPTSQTVTVNLQGINTIDPTQDWRWCLEEVDSNYNVTYSAVWAPGTHSYTMNNINDRLILFVMATPSNTAEDLGSMYNTKPNDKNIDRLNYPYEVQITGAVPGAGTVQQIGYARSSSGGYHKNPDGSTGGWVDSTASVASTAYVGPHAEVLGNAQVRGSASIQDYAVVAGYAVVQGNAIVSGYAVVRDNATVEANAVVRDHATVASYSLVEGSAQIEDYAFLTDNATYTDSTIARGEVFPVAGGTYSGTTILDYDYSFNWSETTGVHQGHFPWGAGDFQHYFDDTQVTPANLIASYSCSEPSGNLLWDEFGCEQAVLRGTPNLVEDPNFQSDVLSFNGSSQWVDLDSNLADLNAATYAMWVDPTSSTANQALLYFGGSTGNYLELTARDANGYAHLTMSVGGVVQQLVSTVAVPLNQWTNVALSFGSGTATFYINGSAAGSGAVSYVPRNVLGPNDLVAAQGFYLGRDASGDYFTGRMDDMRFYNGTLAAAQVQNEMQRSGALIGLFYANTPTTFDGSTTKAESGVHNGMARTLMATINPTASPNEGSFYQPLLDSNYEYGANQTTTFQGSGLGLNNGYFYVLLDGYGMWNTGVQVQFNTWQTVAVTFDGSVAKFYTYNTTTSTWVKQGTLNYTADPNNLAGKNYRIGYGLANGNPGNTTYGTQTFFQGQMQNVKIYDRVVITDPSTYSWDTSNTSGYQGGAGTWNASATNWSNGNGTTRVAWPGSTTYTAAFDTDASGSSYTVTVSGTRTPYAIILGDENQLATDQYTLSGSGTLSVGGGGISDYVTGAVNSAVTLSAAQTWQTALGQTLTVGGSVNTGGYALTVNPGTQFPFRWNFGGTQVDDNVSGSDYSGGSGSGATTGIGDVGGPTSGTTTFSGGITGNGSLTMNGAGTLNLSAASTYSGGTTLNNGTTFLSNTSGSALGSGAITVASTATLQVGNANATGSTSSDAITNNGLLEFDRTDSFTASGAIGGTGNLVQMGTGSLTLGSANTYTGPTFIAAGGLVAGNSLALQNSTVNYTTAGTTLGFASGVTSATLGGLQGSNNLNLQNASSAAVALSVGNNNQSTSFSGQLTGSGSLIKIGSGTFTVSAANSYSNGTTVSAGTLLVNNTTGSGLGTGSVNVNSGGTLAGGGMISGKVTVASGGAIAPGAPSGSGTVSPLTVGGLQLASGSILDLEFGSSGYDTIVVTGAAGLTINGGGINLYQAGTTTAFAALGTYTIITHSGAIGDGGVSSLSVLNKLPGLRYSFGDTGTAVTLTITLGPLWSGPNNGVWSNTANWSGVSFLPGESLVYAATGNAGGTSVNDQTNPSYPSAVFNSGAAAFTLSGNGVTFTGDSNGNLVQNLSSSTQTLALPITLGAAGALNAASGPIVLGGTGSIATSAGKGLVIQGAGGVSLNGTVTGSGGVTESAGAGSLNINNANALGSGMFKINGGTIDNTSGAAVTIASNNPQTWNGNFTFNGTNNLNFGSGGVNVAAQTIVTTNAGTLTVGGNIANASTNALRKSGTGTLVLQNGSVTLSPNWYEFIYNGALVLSNYTINWTNETAWEHLFYGPQSTTSLTLQNGSTFSGNNVLLADDGNGGTLSVYDTSHFQTASGYDLEITRRGNATVNQDGGTVDVGGNLDYNNFWGSGSNCTGVYNLDAGTLLLHNGIVVQPYTTSTFNFGGGMMKFSNSQTVGGLNTMAIYAAGNTLGNSTATGGAVINTNGNYITFTQTLTNGNGGTDGGLTKLGAGTLELDAASTYTGPTVVSAGTLLVKNTSGSGTGTGAVTDNATLTGTGTIGGSLNVGSSGTLDPGTIGGIGTLTVNGAATLAGTTVADINKSGTTLTSSLLTGASTLTYGGTLTVTLLSGSTALAASDTFTLFSASSYAGHFTAFNLPSLASGLQWNLSNLAVNGTISVIASNNPQVAVPASATLAANGKTASLSVLGNDNGGEANLKYTWSYTGPSGVTYSANGTNAAKNATATFTQTGTYTFTVTITNSGGYTNSSNVTLTVNQVAVSLAITPTSVALSSHGTQTFTVTSATDQFGSAISSPTVSWTAVSGTITSGGAYTAPYAAGSDTVTASSGLVVATASATITNAAPAVAAAALANGNTPGSAMGTTTTLTVLGADADGGGEQNLTYTWSATGPAAVTYSANGTNAAKSTTASFSKAGTYSFTVTIADGGGLTCISSVQVTVNPILWSIAVTPAYASMNSGATQQFTAAGFDQFGASIAATITWSVSGGGSITAAGLFTAPSSGTPIVIASSGLVAGAAKVAIPAPVDWWKLDGNGSDAIRSNTLTLVNSPSFATGESGQCLSLTGNGAYAMTSTSSILNTHNAFSVSAWVNWNGTDGFITAVSEDGSSNSTFYLQKRSGASFAFVGDNGSGGQNFAIWSTMPTPNIWYHLVGVYTGTQLQLYVNGALVASASWSTIAAPTGSLIVGAAKYGGGRVDYFQGMIDDVRIYNSALSTAAISALYLSYAAPVVPTVATPASASPSPVNTAGTSLSVLGSETTGESGLTYTWSLVGTPPAPVTFGANGTNAAKNTTATFTAAGTYNFAVRIADASGNSVVSYVTVVVNQVATSIVVTPGSVALSSGASQPFAAVEYDQFGAALTSQPTFTWNKVSGAGSINASGLYTASYASGSAVVQASSGGINSNMATVTITDAAPTVATVAKADGSTSDTVTGTTAALSVLGADTDDGGESNLSYTWTTTGTPPAAVNFSTGNGTNAGKNTTATFSKAGSYSFLVTITDLGGQSTTSIVSLTVQQTLTRILLGPATTNLGSGQTQQFTATGFDQFGAALSNQPAFTWSKLSGTGSINSFSGLYTAPYASGSATVQAISGSVTSNMASVTINDATPTVDTAAKADGSTSDTVTGTTAVLSVLGADTDGGGESNLSYTWTTTGTPPAAVNFSAGNGTNAGKNTTATFSKAGSYSFLVTITDLGGKSTTGSVSLTVQQTATSCSVSPLSASITAGGTQQFAATAVDQFGDALVVQPMWNWSVSDNGYEGMIDPSGLYTPPYAPGTYGIQVSGSGVSNTAAVIVAGQAQWSSVADNSWSGAGNWQDTISNLPVSAAPGIRSGILGDTVLFATTSVPVVQLDGATPSLSGMTFNNANVSYTIAADSGGGITLQSGQRAAVAVQAGTHSISAPLGLATYSDFDTAAGTSLTVSGAISGAGRLSKSGDGTLILSGTNKYAGGTVVTSGTLVILNPSAIPDGTELTVGEGWAAAPVIPAVATATFNAAGAATIAPLATAPVSTAMPALASAKSAENHSAGLVSAHNPPAGILPQANSLPAARSRQISPVAARCIFGSQHIARPSGVRRIGESPNWLQATDDPNDRDTRHSKGRAILALDAAFAQYAN